jgi:hypothetical protein
MRGARAAALRAVTGRVPQRAPRAPMPPYADAGAATLSLQPPYIDEEDERPAFPDWPTIYAYLENRLNSLRSWRYSWWQHWAILAQYILPYRYHWVVTPNTYNRGFPVNDSIVNETATLAMRTCAAGLLSGLMSPSRPWFRFDPPLASIQIDAAGRVWLDWLAEIVQAVLAGSNWYLMGAQMFQDVATFGTSPMIIYEDAEDIIRCYVPCAGEAFLAAGARLSVDTLYREFTYTVAQIVEFFKLENCPIEVQELWRQGRLDHEFVIVHAIEPNFDIADRGGHGSVTVVPGGFPWREVYWLRGRLSEHPLSLLGFPEKPFMATRWSSTSNDAYGRGPGMDALGGTRQLQIEERRKGEYIQKMVRPPMVADVTLENKPSSIRSGEITFVNAQEGKHQFYPAFEINAQGLVPMVQDIERIETRINRCFFTDVFMLLTQMEGVQPRSEFELAQRIGEKIQVLGPIIELFEQEVAPALQRVVAIMGRRGFFERRPPPASLRGVPISITYTSMMKMAQRAAQTAAMERTFAVFGKLGEAAQLAQVPSPLRILNLDESGRVYAELNGFPGKCIFTEAQVAEMDKERAQRQAMDQALAASVPAVQAAEGLSRIPAGGGSSVLSELGPGGQGATAQ